MTPGAADRPDEHVVKQPAPWVAGCSDRGLRHPRNEDALALAAGPEPGSAAVLVVCDGVSTAPGSDVAALAAARAARDLLVARAHPDPGDGRDRQARTLAEAVARAVDAAQRAVLDVPATADPGETGDTGDTGDSAEGSSASCTLVCAVLRDRLLVYGHLGDSRAYWFPDDAPALLLTEDDSLAQLRIAAGVDRDEAEQGPGAHAITRWLGPDYDGAGPRPGALELLGAGWVLLCTDGLWNYASDAAALQEVFTRLARTTADPAALASALVQWARDQGGHDNITVALARMPAAGPT